MRVACEVVAASSLEEVKIRSGILLRAKAGTAHRAVANLDHVCDPLLAQFVGRATLETSGVAG
jgi:hypothetical protein